MIYHFNPEELQQLVEGIKKQRGSLKWRLKKAQNPKLSKTSRTLATEKRLIKKIEICEDVLTRLS